MMRFFGNLEYISNHRIVKGLIKIYKMKLILYKLRSIFYKTILIFVYNAYDTMYIQKLGRDKVNVKHFIFIKHMGEILRLGIFC